MSVLEVLMSLGVRVLQLLFEQESSKLHVLGIRVLTSLGSEIPEQRPGDVAEDTGAEGLEVLMSLEIRVLHSLGIRVLMLLGSEIPEQRLRCTPLSHGSCTSSSSVMRPAISRPFATAARGTSFLKALLPIRNCWMM
jgi:hypothetical protein